jgi:hypothetical protein
MQNDNFLVDITSYQRWKKARLEHCPRSVEDLIVEIGGLVDLGDAEKA